MQRHGDDSTHFIGWLVFAAACCAACVHLPVIAAERVGWVCDGAVISALAELNVAVATRHQPAALNLDVATHIAVAAAAESAVSLPVRMLMLSMIMELGHVPRGHGRHSTQANGFACGCLICFGPWAVTARIQGDETAS